MTRPEELDIGKSKWHNDIYHHTEVKNITLKKFMNILVRNASKVKEKDTLGAGYC